MIACLILAFSSPFELNGFLHALSAYQLALEFFLKCCLPKDVFPSVLTFCAITCGIGAQRHSSMGVPEHAPGTRTSADHAAGCHPQPQGLPHPFCTPVHFYTFTDVKLSVYQHHCRVKNHQPSFLACVGGRRAAKCQFGAVSALAS